MKNNIKRVILCSFVFVILALILSGVGYALTREEVIQTTNETLNWYFNLSKNTIDYLFYRNLYDESVINAKNGTERLKQYENDLAIETTLLQRSAVLKLAVEGGLLTETVIIEREQAFTQRNPDISVEDTDLIVGMQIYSSVTGQIMSKYLPQLMEGTYQTDDEVLLAAMDDYKTTTDKFRISGTFNEFETEATLNLYNEFLNHLVRIYINTES